LLSCILLSGCVAPKAFEARFKGVETRVEKIGENLKTLADTKADTTTVAEEIGEVRNEINQTTQVAEKLLDWHDTIVAENVNYGGAGWVVLGSIGLTAVFLGTGALIIYILIRKASNLKAMLKLVTGAVSSSPESIQKAIKTEIKRETKENGQRKLRENLRDFTQTVKTFANAKCD
jgi:hypothetical protein